MSAVDEIMAEIPIDELAGRLGVDAATAERASRQALPALLGGIQANTDDPGGAASFARAVQQHDGGLVQGGVNLDEVDTRDGGKIVSNVFGPNRPQVVHALGGVGGTGGQDLINKLLPILAPIVMSWLARKLSGSAAGPGTGAGGLGDMLGPILGSVLGGATTSAGGAGGAGDLLGDLLGGLLGGGRR